MSDIALITPNWSAPTHVKAVISTRAGGVSVAPFESLNVGLHVNDNEAAVFANRARLSRAAGIPNHPVWLNQVHGDHILALGSTTLDCVPEADGVITKEEGVVCAIMTADCLPLFICNATGSQVGLLHVGWRGLATGIIEKCVRLFDDKPQNMMAWAGPCISQTYFEVGLEVREQLGGADQFYRDSSAHGKVYADMYGLVGQRLRDLGVTDYGYRPYCTYRDTELFFSHRRDSVSGRQVSLIWID